MFLVEPVENTEIDASEANQLRELHVSLLTGKQNQQDNQQSKARAEGAGRKLYTVFVGSIYEDMKDIARPCCRG